MGKPPIGEKRFKRPEVVDPWPGLFNASKRSNACFNVLDTMYGSKCSLFHLLTLVTVHMYLGVVTPYNVNTQWLR